MFAKWDGLLGGGTVFRSLRMWAFIGKLARRRRAVAEISSNVVLASLSAGDYTGKWLFSPVSV